MNIAIYGGSFDPPHIGHEEIIKTALKQLDIDILFVVPAFLNPFKKSFFAPAEKRYKWIKKVVQNYPKVKILSFEIEKKRPVATIETVKYLKSIYKIDKIYLIIGADNLTKLDRWKNFDELNKLVDFVIASRDDENIPENLQKLDIHVSISSTKLREKIDKKYLPKSVAEEIMEYYEQKS